MVFGSNLTGLYSGLQPLAAPAKKTTGPFVAAVKYAPAYTPRPEGHKLVAPLWSRNVTLSSGSNGGVVCDIAVLRLRPKLKPSREPEP